MKESRILCVLLKVLVSAILL